MAWMKWNSLRLSLILMILSLSIKSVVAEHHTMMKKSIMNKYLKNTCENNYKLFIIHKSKHFLDIF